MIEHARQYATTLDGIRADHVARYRWAASALATRFCPGDRLVDAGAGCGYGSHLLAEAGFQVTALELDPEAIAYAGRHWAHPRVERVALDLAAPADHEGWGELPGALAMVAFEVIEHLQDPLHLLRQACDAGVSVVVGSVPNEAVLPFDPARHKYHVRHYDAEQLATLLRQGGYGLTLLGGQQGKRGEAAEVLTATEGAMTLVFAARLVGGV